MIRVRTPGTALGERILSEEGCPRRPGRLVVGWAVKSRKPGKDFLREVRRCIRWLKESCGADSILIPFFYDEDLWACEAVAGALEGQAGCLRKKYLSEETLSIALLRQNPLSQRRARGPDPDHRVGGHVDEVVRNAQLQQQIPALGIPDHDAVGPAQYKSGEPPVPGGEDGADALAVDERPLAHQLGQPEEKQVVEDAAAGVTADPVIRVRTPGTELGARILAEEGCPRRPGRLAVGWAVNEGGCRLRRGACRSGGWSGGWPRGSSGRRP